MQSEKKVQVPFTANHLKVSKSISKGDRLESKVSLFYHNRFPAILVSALLLRSYGCGQVDICYYLKNTIFLLEVKSSPELINYSQRQRLNHSLEFISQILGVQGVVQIIKKLPK